MSAGFGDADIDRMPDTIDAVVIGASAGGVEALSVLLPALPANLRATVFIVQHLPRERESLLCSIFATKCVRPVREAQDKEPIEPGSVYFAPPNYHLLIDDDAGGIFPAACLAISPAAASADIAANNPFASAGTLHLALSVDDLVNYSRPAIDVLFESAADIYGARLMGIILTGANGDGAAGLAAVQRAGGIALVQEPESAYMSLMPESALKQTPDALVRPLAQIANLLQKLGSSQALETTHVKI